MSRRNEQGSEKTEKTDETPGNQGGADPTGPPPQAARGRGTGAPAPARASIGRIVHYAVRTNELGNNGQARVAPAVITHVHDADAGIVNLKVLLNGPSTLFINDAVYYAGEHTPPDVESRPYWTWPPRV